MAIKERILGTMDASEMIGKDGLSMVNGRVEAFTADRPAWWDLEGAYVVKGAPTWEAAMALSMPWTVVERPVHAEKSDGSVRPEAIKGFKALVRSDTGTTLAIVKNSYHVIQNKFAFDYTEALLEVGASYESAGVLGNGEQIWTLARVPQADFSVSSGDEHKAFLLFMSSHDGSMSAQAMLTDWRVVCRNTARFALKEDGKNAFKIRHTKSADAKLEQAKRLVSGAVNNSHDVAQKLRDMAEKQITRENMTSILDRLFPKSTVAGASETRRDNVLSEILGLYESNDENAFPEQRGTAYNLYNAVTNYTDHVRGARITEGRKGMSMDSARAENAMFGTGARLKAEAFDVIYQLVGGGTETRTETRYVEESASDLLENIVSNN